MKNQFLKRYVYYYSIVLFACLIIFSENAYAEYTLINEKNAVSKARVQEVQHAIEIYQKVLQKYFQEDLKEDVKIFICANKKDFANVLVRESDMIQEEAEKAAENTVGMATEKIVVLDAEEREDNTKKDFLHTVAHELFHHTQDRLSSDSFTTGEMYWFVEGTADLAGALALVENGKYKTLKDWQIDVINNLQEEEYDKPKNLFYFDYEKWRNSPHEVTNYGVSDLMVYYFIEHFSKGKNSNSYNFQSVISFFNKAHNKQNLTREEVLKMFKDTYGYLDTKSTVNDLQNWFLNKVQLKERNDQEEEQAFQSNNAWY